MFMHVKWTFINEIRNKDCSKKRIETINQMT